MANSMIRAESAAEPEWGSFKILSLSSLPVEITENASTESQNPSMCNALVSQRLKPMNDREANASAISLFTMNLFAKINTNPAGMADIKQTRAPVRGKKAGMIFHSLSVGLTFGNGIRDKNDSDKAIDFRTVFIFIFIFNLRFEKTLK